MVFGVEGIVAGVGERGVVSVDEVEWEGGVDFDVGFGGEVVEVEGETGDDGSDIGGAGGGVGASVGEVCGGEGLAP